MAYGNRFFFVVSVQECRNSISHDLLFQHLSSNIETRIAQSVQRLGYALDDRGLIPSEGQWWKFF